MSVMASEEYGGSGASFFSTVLLIEEIGKVDMGVSTLLEIQNNLITPFFEKFGSDEQKKKYVPRLCTDTVS